MSSSLKQLAVATVWFVVAMAGAFGGSAAVVLACSQDIHELWLAELMAIVLLPSILLHFALDWWRPASRWKLAGFALPLVVGLSVLAALVDVRPTSIDGLTVGRYALAFGGALAAVAIVLYGKRRFDARSPGGLQFGLASLFIAVTLGAVFCACLKTFGLAIGSYACGWAVVVLLLMSVVQGTDKQPRRGWLAATLLAIVAIYGPLVVGVVVTWVSNSCGHCRWTALEFFALMPGGIIEILVLRTSRAVPQPVAIAIAAALSLMIVAVTAWLAQRTGRARWIMMAIVSCLAVWTAWAADAILRA